MNFKESYDSPIQEKITLKKGTTINRGPHEDDDYLVLLETLTVNKIGESDDGSWLVELPGLDGIFYYHQPTKKSS